MKFLLTILFFGCSLSFLRAQETIVDSLPAIVTDTFTLLYPDAKSIEWQFIDGHYKAEFKNYKTPTMAMIDAQGILIQTRTQIKTTALPEPAIEYLAQNFADQKIDMATITEDEKGVITFTAIIDKADFTFDSSGRLLDTHGVVINSPEKAD